MRDPDRGDSVAAGQGRCGCALLEQFVEHGIRPAWDGECVGEDHDWRRRRVHVDCIDAWVADFDGFKIGFAVGAGKCASASRDSDACATSVTRRACWISRSTRWIFSSARGVAGGTLSLTGSISRGEEVARMKLLFAASVR